MPSHGKRPPRRQQTVPPALSEPASPTAANKALLAAAVLLEIAWLAALLTLAVSG